MKPFTTAPVLRHLTWAALTLAACAAQPALAQPAWPSKPIRLIVTGPAGCTADTLARLLAEGLHQDLKYIGWRELEQS